VFSFVFRAILPTSGGSGGKTGNKLSGNVEFLQRYLQFGMSQIHGFWGLDNFK
jgi:hypothetical protein